MLQVEVTSTISENFCASVLEEVCLELSQQVAQEALEDAVHVKWVLDSVSEGECARLLGGVVAEELGDIVRSGE